MSFLRLFVIVKEKSACILERFGKFHKQLDPGFHIMVPLMDRIAYKQSLKEEAIQIDDQTAITKDNVTVQIDGTLFVQIHDPYKASYQVERPYEAVRLLALTVLRSEIGKMKLDKLFQERQELNLHINESVNIACQEWGLTCLRYEILNIEPPQEIKQSMQFEAEAERLKRREILISEGKQKAQINISTGQKISVIKAAEGQAESLEIISQKEAEGLSNIAAALKLQVNSQETISYLLTQHYLQSYKKTLGKANVVVTPKGQKIQNADGTVSGGNNDQMLTMAAMMMFQKGSPSGKFDPALIESYIKQIQNRSSNSPNAMAEQEETYNNMLTKLQFYDDPLLYSDSNIQNPGDKISDRKTISEEDREDFYQYQGQNQQNQNNNDAQFNRYKDGGSYFDSNSSSSESGSNTADNEYLAHNRQNIINENQQYDNTKARKPISDY